MTTMLTPAGRPPRYLWPAAAALPALALLLAGCYDTAPPPSPTRPLAAIEAYESATTAMRAGDTAAALTDARRAHEADPEFDEAALLLASLLGREGDFDEALALCAEVSARMPDLVQAHLLQGILWDRSGDSDAARQSYDAALRGFAALPDRERNRPETGLQEALATFLRHGKLEGVRAVNRVLAAYPDYGPAAYVKACMLDKDRGFLLRWFSEGGDVVSPAGG